MKHRLSIFSENCFKNEWHMFNVIIMDKKLEYLEILDAITP